VETLEAGADDYVTKPFPIRELWRTFAPLYDVRILRSSTPIAIGAPRVEYLAAFETGIGRPPSCSACWVRISPMSCGIKQSPCGVGSPMLRVWRSAATVS